VMQLSIVHPDYVPQNSASLWPDVRRGVAHLFWKSFECGGPPTSRTKELMRRPRGDELSWQTLIAH
jgi:hypothetical protein